MAIKNLSRTVLFLVILLGQGWALASEPEFKHSYLQTTGESPVNIHYVTMGSEQVDAVVLLHGFPQFWYMWQKHMQILSQKYFVVAPDLRGFNESSKLANVEDYAIPKVVEDIRQLLVHLKKRRVVLVGHDWGGLIAHGFALTYPELVKRLVVINAPHPMSLVEQLETNEAQRRGLDYIIGLRKLGSEQMLFAKPEILEGAMFYADPEAKIFTSADRAAYKSTWTVDSLRAGLNYYRAALLGPPDFWEKNTGGVEGFPIENNYLPQMKSYMLKMPTLYIWGMKDTHLFPTLLDGVEKYGAKVEVLRVEEGTHWVPNEFPEIVSDAILKFAR